MVGGFWPIGSEIDVRPALARLRALGARIALPETTPRGSPLRFRLWDEGAPLLPGRYGTLHPDGAEVEPGLLLVPLLAFDRRGFRLGYGGGYYDRTIAGWPGVCAIGCAYAAQEVPHVPTEQHDRVLPAIATERGVIVTTG
jgi:5-formyltetrahydrofolate cyclo-ligase